MAHKTTITREYADAAAFRLDEMKLGQQGWSVETQATVAEGKDFLHRMMARFVPSKQEKEPLIVTYSRPTPS